MNNKGQVLIIFVILIPILILVMSMIVNIGYLQIEKKNIDNTVRDALEFYLNSSDTDKDTLAKELINKNIATNNISIDEDEFYVEISVSAPVKGILNKNEDKYNVTYRGYKDTLKIIKGWYNVIE